MRSFREVLLKRTMSASIRQWAGLAALRRRAKSERLEYSKPSASTFTLKLIVDGCDGTSSRRSNLVKFGYRSSLKTMKPVSMS